MNELINIIINVLQNTDNGQSVKFTKKSDSIFLFEGEGADSVGNQYGYEIEVRYKLKEGQGLTAKAKALKEMEDKMEKK